MYTIKVMTTYSNTDLQKVLRYFRAKFPILSFTKACFTQRIDTDTKGMVVVGYYDSTTNTIIILDDPRADFFMYETFAHEVAHAINWLRNKEHGHTDSWRAVCREVYEVTGILPSRVKNSWPDDCSMKQPKNPYEGIPQTIKYGDDETVIYIKRHKERIKYWMTNFANALIQRAEVHDNSKLQEPELSMWRNMDKEPRYPYSEKPDSPYQQKLKRYYPVFEQHWKTNRHHLEYFRYNEDFGLDLLDLIELICDQLLGYKMEMGYDRAMRECDRLQDRYDLPLPILDLIRNTVRNYFLTTLPGALPLHCEPIHLDDVGSKVDMQI